MVYKKHLEESQETRKEESLESSERRRRYEMT
jgi:hypothetical protein